MQRLTEALQTVNCRDYSVYVLLVISLTFSLCLLHRAGEENPASLAESCFRELLGRAAYGNMNNAVRPVLV